MYTVEEDVLVHEQNANIGDNNNLSYYLFGGYLVLVIMQSEFNIGNQSSVGDIQSWFWLSKQKFGRLG